MTYGEKYEKMKEENIKYLQHILSTWWLKAPWDQDFFNATGCWQFCCWYGCCCVSKICDTYFYLIAVEYMMNKENDGIETRKYGDSLEGIIDKV